MYVYHDIIEKAKKNMIYYNKIKRNKIFLTEECKGVLDGFYEEDLNYLSIIKRKTIFKN